MNDIINEFPYLKESIKNAKILFEKLNKYRGIKEFIAEWNDLSRETYRSYNTAIMQFYDFLKGKHILKADVFDIEMFYKKMKENRTAKLRIAGLTFFYKKIKEKICFIKNPAEIFILKNRYKKTKEYKTKSALTMSELNNILNFLKKDKTIYGHGNYCLFYMFFASCLRANELLKIQWKDIENDNGIYILRFIKKGNKREKRIIDKEAIEACYEFFKERYNRDPKENDFLFKTIPRYNGDSVRPLKYHASYYRLKKIGEIVKENKVINRNINFTSNLLRRTRATYLYEKGYKIKDIQKMTGHKSIDTLFRYYIDDDNSDFALHKLA